VLGAQRDSYFAADGSGYLSVLCGQNPCHSDEGFYQDVSITGQGLSSFSFGGKFASYYGPANGAALVFVQQLSSTGALLTQDYQVASITGIGYTSVTSSAVAINGQTATLRYIVFLSGIGATDALKADDLYVNPYPNP
jgi:hypothetical protein